MFSNYFFYFINKNNSNEKIQMLEEFDDSDLDPFNTYRQKILGAFDRLNYEDINKHKERLQVELNYLKKLYNMEKQLCQLRIILK